MTKKLAEYNTSDGGKALMFFCPGCNFYHSFQIEPGSTNRPTWTWNGDMEKPTFSPSLGINMMFPESRCHSFVRDGKIEFLSDCFHELKGRTVDLQEVDW